MDDIATLVVVRSFLNDIDAELAVSALEAAGIPAMIRRDTCGGVRPHLSLSGIQVVVRDSDLADANAVLDTPTAEAPDAIVEEI